MPLIRLKEYFIGTVMPLWACIAFDADAGQFMEGLQLDGSADPSNIVRTRTAAREIYVFAHAAALGVGPEGGLEKAERAFQNLRRIAWLDGATSGYARAFNYRTGLVTDPERDLYDQACVLLALAWLARATGRKSYAAHIDELVAAMDVTLAAPHGGWAEDSIGSIPRRQNPHMHCLEAFLALWETAGAPAHVERAHAVFDLFRTHFFDSSIDTLRENYGPAWEISDAYRSDRLEPGHMAEWVWLTRRYDRLAGTDNSSYASALLGSALRLGPAGNTPFLLDETNADGRPLKATRRLWPQAELLKAYLMEARATGEATFFAKAEAVARALFETYLADTPAGTWRDCFDADGRCVATSIPGSSLYHLWSGVAELLEPEPGSSGNF